MQQNDRSRRSERPALEWREQVCRGGANRAAAPRACDDRARAAAVDGVACAEAEARYLRLKTSSVDIDAFVPAVLVSVIVRPSAESSWTVLATSWPLSLSVVL